MLILVNFGEAVIAYGGEFDGPDKIKGTMRATYGNRVFEFPIVRRP